MIGTFVTGGIVSFLTSQIYRSDGRIRVRRREGERYIDACVQQTDGNVVPSIMVWGAFHFGGKSEQVIVEGPWTSKFTDGWSEKKFLPWARGTFHNTFVLVQNKAPPHEVRATKTFL